MTDEERLICGLQPVREAIAAHGSKLRVLVESKREAPQLDAVARFAKDRGAKVERVSRSELDKRAHGVRHQGAIASGATAVVVGRPIRDAADPAAAAAAIKHALQ